MTMRACIHRGADQVGGTCVELECDGQRLLLDLGMPLDAKEGEVPLPTVAGLRDADPSLLGVVVTHLHGDHCGLVPYARPGLPFGIGEKASRILREAEFFTRRPPLPEPRWPLCDRQPFDVGPFRITPLQVEHSAFDAFALLVEAGGRRLLYTGDFRAHGNDDGPWQRLLRDPPKGVDVLLMEGTLVGAGREGEGGSEAELRGRLAERFRDAEGLVLAAWSSQNLDRLRTMHEAARDAGRTLVIDLYTATLARAADAPGIPMLETNGVEVYVRRREINAVKGSREFHRTDGVKPWRLFTADMLPRSNDLVLLLRPSMIDELEDEGVLVNARGIWSMWAGYLRNPAERRMLRLLERYGVPLEHRHVSGHAYASDLRRLAEAVAPGVLVPIHTERPRGFASLYGRVHSQPDGTWWAI